MKFKKYASKKVIAVILTGLLVTGSFINQQLKIKQLQKDLYIQQNIIENKYSYTQTSLLKDTIQTQVNDLCNYQITNNTVNIKHTFNYQRESIFNFKSIYTLTGTADFYYSYSVSLSEARVTHATDNKIVIEVPAPQLDEKACHRVRDTFYKIEDECSNNLLSNKQDAEKTARKWEDTFDTKGIEYIKDYYSSYDMQNKLEYTTIEQIQLLLKELGYSQSVQVKIY